MSAAISGALARSPHVAALMRATGVVKTGRWISRRRNPPRHCPRIETLVGYASLTHPTDCPRGALVQRQPHPAAVVVAGIAVRRLVEGIGELPFLRLVAPLRGGMADDVVGTAGDADRRGAGGAIDDLPLDRLPAVLRCPVLRRLQRVEQSYAWQT